METPGRGRPVHVDLHLRIRPRSLPIIQGEVVHPHRIGVGSGVSIQLNMDSKVAVEAVDGLRIEGHVYRDDVTVGTNRDEMQLAVAPLELQSALDMG